MLGNGKKQTKPAVREVMIRLCELKGIGPATASALLAHLDPERFPFMSDEALEGCGMRREYTLEAYLAFAEALTSKAKELGSEWDAEKVGRAMWARAMTCAYALEMSEKKEERCKEEEETNEMPKRKKRKRMQRGRRE
eukprot:764708-Hanusia_phi.AAC.5